MKKSIKSLGLKPETINSIGGSDINVIRQNGINGLLIASGSMNAHSNDEYIKIRDLEMIVQIIRNIIDKWIRELVSREIVSRISETNCYTYYVIRFT